jgi:hypothetical protein
VDVWFLINEQSQFAKVRGHKGFFEHALKVREIES